MTRARVLAIVWFAIGCGGPSATGSGSGAIADAAGSGMSTGASGNAGTGSGASGSGASGQSQNASEDGGTGALDAAASDPRTACEHYVQAFCERQGHCQNLDWSIVTSCKSIASLCPDFVFSPGSTRTPAVAEACAAAVLAQGCDDFNAGVGLPCQTPGTVKPGQRCHFNSQCETLACLGDSPGGCGYCARTLGPNDNCLNADGACPLDQVCDKGVTNRCVALPLVVHGGGQGAPCGPSMQCDPPLECILAAGADAQTGTCGPPPDAGASCELVLFSNGLRVCEPFATCNGISASQCVARVPEGQPCNVVPSGDPCAIGAYCDVGDAGTVGICRPNRAAGQPCALGITSGGPRCMSGICAGGICAPLPPGPPGIGSPCGVDAAACAFGLWCENGTCQTAACAVVTPEAGAD
jgi:hypothetical protein